MEEFDKRVPMLSHLSTTYRQEVSWNGYRADVLKSGIQKYIRRGMTEKALYCAGELDLFKEATDKSAGEGIRTNFLHRLMVIYMEDVENRSILVDIDKKMKELFTERTLSARSKEKEERLISEVVVELGHSTKARVCSHIRAVFNAKYKDIRQQYPEVSALWNEIEQNEKRRVEAGTELFPFLCDSFTIYLKQKNILAVYYGFHIEGSSEKLKEAFKGSKKPVWYIFKELSTHSEDKLFVNIMIQWYKEHIGTLNEGFMCWLYPLLLELGVITKGEKPAVRFEDYPLNWDANRSNQRIEIDDFVLDKHTARGRGKGLVEFALTGSLVENPASFVNPMWKQFYEDGKRWEEKIPILGPSGATTSGATASGATASAPLKIKKPTMKKDPAPVVAAPPMAAPLVAAPLGTALEEEKQESEMGAFEFIVRTQLTTMGTKMDVYLAKDRRTSSVVMVKGPYQNRTEIDILLSTTEWKKKHNLPYNRFEVRSLIPNRWPDGVPLGARNKVNRSRPSYFLVFESYLQEGDIKTISRSSPLWPETKVVDWENIPFHFDYKSRPLTEQEYKDYVHALLFRYVLGISDYADRNFLMKGGRVISIDEDVENKPIDLYATLKKNKADFILQWLKSNYEKLDVASWTPKDPSNAEQVRKLAEIQSKETCLQLFQGKPSEPAKALELSEALESAKALESAQERVKEVAPLIKEAIKPEISISTMNDNFVFIDNLYRSRITLLDILAERGYDVEKYRKFSPAEATAAASSLAGLSFIVTKKDNAEQVCDVRYITNSRPKMDVFFNDIPDEKSETTEVIVMMEGSVAEIHHQAALKQYMKWKEPNEAGEKSRRKLRVSFFSIYALVVNPMRHVLVPKHEIIPDVEDAHKKLMESMYITSKTKFPEIKFHTDPIARCIGAVPGDIVKITRPSASSGEAIVYRVCAP